MAQVVTTTEMIARVAEKTNRPVAGTRDVISTFLRLIMDALSNRETVVLGEFGNFYVGRLRERAGRNPTTGETEIFPEVVVPRFSAQPGFRERIKVAYREGAPSPSLRASKDAKGIEGEETAK